MSPHLRDAEPGSLLAVLATCYQDVTLIEACCAWLYASSPKQLKYIDLMPALQGVVPAPAAPAGSPAATRSTSSPPPGHGHPQQGTLVPWRKWSLEDLSFIVMSLCQSQLQRNLLKTFRLFDSASPFVKFLMFQEAFLQGNFPAAKKHLIRFVRCWLTPLVA